MFDCTAAADSRRDADDDADHEVQIIDIEPSCEALAISYIANQRCEYFLFLSVYSSHCSNTMAD